jgi:HTH-type transcriptional regulator/antitoxin HigA
MIHSERQYTVSREQLAKLEAALSEANGRDVEQSWLKQAEIDALKSQIEEVRDELVQYDLLRAGEFPFTKTHSLERLPSVLVQARIASGMSQTDLASELGVKPQQIQRYEATSYMGASLGRLIAVARVLGVKTSGAIEGARGSSSAVFVWSEADDVVWSQLPYKEMIRRNWFEVRKGERPLESVKTYFLTAAGPQFATALHRKKTRSGNVPNEYALLAWQARVLALARTQIDRGHVGEFLLDDSWLPELSALTRRADGPKRAVSVLAAHGIPLVVEEHLPETYLDGAAMLADSGQPVVALTLRYDRLDNFWFVLFHELGHVFLHLLNGLHFDFFDEVEAVDSDSMEDDADRFALNSLIPSEVWDECLSRFALSEEAVQIDAERLRIHPSILAGRIRREQNDYTLLSGLVGQGQVRRHFAKQSDTAE